MHSGLVKRAIMPLNGGELTKTHETNTHYCLGERSVIFGITTQFIKCRICSLLWAVHKTKTGFATVVIRTNSLVNQLAGFN